MYVLSDDETKITAATMAKLVSHLADEKAADIDFVNVFLLTYRRYASPFQLLAFLEKRFFLDPPPDASQEILDAFSNCRKVVMVRVVNVLRRWMEEFPFDFTPDLLRAFRTFRATVRCFSSPLLSSPLFSFLFFCDRFSQTHSRHTKGNRR